MMRHEIAPHSVPVPLSKRARNAYLRVGLTEEKSRDAWQRCADQARAQGYEGMLFFATLRRSRGWWWFITYTETDPARYFGVHVAVEVEPSTVSKSRIVWSASRERGYPGDAFRRCCGCYVPHGHLETCVYRPMRRVKR